MANAQSKRTSQQTNPSEQWRQMIAKTRKPYLNVVEKKKTPLDFASEEVFAVQACMNNDKLREVATKNPDSLRLALLNSAAVGISLNPAEHLAYLVPREGRVVLDISYRGLIKIAADIGSIRWAKAELVFGDDRFRANGPGKMPIHEYDPFSDERGDFRGAYCIARLPATGKSDESNLVEFMKASEIYKVRDQSILYALKKKGPWVDWFEEMVKKTVIKRASKTWPHSGGRLAEAIQMLNEQGEGLPSIEGSLLMNIEREADPENASEHCRTKTHQLVERACKTDMWSAAEQYAREQFKNPDDLQYALRELKRNKPAPKPLKESEGEAAQAG